MKRGRAIWASYDDVNALDIECSNCGAQPGNWCTKPDGRVAKVPCVSRAATGGLLMADTRPHHDFSEPRHPPQREP